VQPGSTFDCSHQNPRKFELMRAQPLDKKNRGLPRSRKRTAMSYTRCALTFLAPQRRNAGHYRQICVDCVRFAAAGDCGLCALCSHLDLGGMHLAKGGSEGGRKGCFCPWLCAAGRVPARVIGATTSLLGITPLIYCARAMWRQDLWALLPRPRAPLCAPRVPWKHPWDCFIYYVRTVS